MDVVGVMATYLPLVHFTSLHFTSLHSTPLHFTTFHFAVLHFTTFLSTPFYFATLHFTTLHFTSLHFTSLHLTSLHFTSLHYTSMSIFNFPALLEVSSLPFENPSSSEIKKSWSRSTISREVFMGRCLIMCWYTILGQPDSCPRHRPIRGSKTSLE